MLNRLHIGIIRLDIGIRPDIGIMVRVFANGPGDLGPIPGRFTPKTQKMELETSLLNTEHYKVQVKSKWSNPGIGVVLLIRLGVVAIKKGRFWVTLDYGRQFYLHDK